MPRCKPAGPTDTGSIEPLARSIYSSQTPLASINHAVETSGVFGVIVLKHKANSYEINISSADQWNNNYTSSGSIDNCHPVFY